MAQPIQLLLIEDNRDAAYLIRKLFEEIKTVSFHITHVERLAAGLAHLSAQPVDAILLDLSLPDSTGLETLTRAHAHQPNAPIIVLTSLDDEAVALQAVRQGAQDYLIQGQADGALIARAIRYAIERKRAEGEIRRLNAELEQRVVERTAELEAANKELDTFAYSVSHDLRAPLRHIDGFIELLQAGTAGQLDEQSRHYLERTREASRRMGQLIDDLLNLSRVTRREMSRAPVDLSALAREIAAELQAREPQRQVEFAIADRIIVQGDAHLLRIALENLMNNAWKFTGPRPLARIEIGAREHDGARATFVRDNGVGFDMAYADKLFTPFQRLHGTQEFPGTGIGLATVQRIIHRHGGRVWAEAVENQGATFYFTLGGAE